MSELPITGLINDWRSVVITIITGVLFLLILVVLKKLKEIGKEKKDSDVK